MIMIIEEAYKYFSTEAQKRYDLGEGPGMSFLRFARKIRGGTSVILTDQEPSKLHQTALANCANIISFGLVHSDDIRQAASAQGLEPFQAKELSGLGDRQIVARLRRYPKPLKIEIDEMSFPAPVSVEQAKARSKHLLDGIPFVDAKDRQPEKPDVPLADNEHITFASIARSPELLGEDRRMRTGLSSDADSRAAKKLRDLGLITLHGRAGAKNKVYGLTAKGADFADKLGLPLAKPHKGGAIHRVLVHYAKLSLDSCFADLLLTETGAAATVDDVQVQPDIVAVHPSGKRLAVQCCVRNKPDYEADRINRLLRLTGIDPEQPDRLEKVVCLAVNKTHRRNVEKAVRKQAGSLPDSLVMLDFDELVKGYEWSDVISF